MEPAAVTLLQTPLELEIDEATALQAENCIKKHVIAAMGIGLIPSAALDVVGITYIEVRMIGKLADIFNFPFPRKLVALKVLISLIGSIGPVYLSRKLHSSLKGVPLLGYAVNDGTWASSLSTGSAPWTLMVASSSSMALLFSARRMMRAELGSERRIPMSIWAISNSAPRART